MYNVYERGGVHELSLTYKIDVMAALKAAGYSTYRIRKEKLLAESTLQSLRDNKSISWDNIAAICALLDCQPGDIMEYVADDEANTDKDA